MDNLTNIQGIPTKCIECKDSKSCDYWRNAYDECVKKLREYEELELTPEQISEIDRAYSEQAKELGEYKNADKKLNGISLIELADAYINIMEKKTGEKYSRGRLLTNADADKWKEYKNAEKQGKLLKLPCAVGDRIYRIDTDEKLESREIEIYDIDNIVILADGTILLKYDAYDGVICELENIVSDKPYLDFYRCFLTKSAAEQALKEMEGVRNGDS